MILLDHVNDSKCVLKSLEVYHHEWKVDSGGIGKDLVLMDDLFENTNNFMKNGKVHLIVAVKQLKFSEEDSMENPKGAQTLNTFDDVVLSAMTSVDADRVTFLCADGKELKAFKKVIGEKSIVFQKMFDTEMEEKSAGSVKIIGFDSFVMSEMLRFINFGSIKSASVQLYEAAKIYMIADLKKACIDLMKLSLNSSNVFYTVEFAHFHDEHELYELCLQIIYR